MKIFFTFLLLYLCHFVNYAQTLSYVDQAVLFSTDDNIGTARYMGLSGAFGALGNDMTAVNINPAGLAVYNGAEFSTTVLYRDTDINSTFYGNTIPNSDDYFRFAQIGGLNTWETYGNPDFYKFSFGFNYNVIKHFNDNYIVNGNSRVPEFVDDPYLNYDDDPFNDIYYVNVDDQYFSNYTSGINDSFTFSFATLYKKKLYMGLTMAFYHLNFYQSTVYEEYNNDGNENLLDAYNSQSLSTYGGGFNFGLGLIYTPVKNLRLGASYQSPVWYNLSERFQDYLRIDLSNDPNNPYYENPLPNYYDYKLKTPSKFVGSLAYVFGQHGLISIDYIYQAYSNTSLSPSSAFIEENSDLSAGLQNTSSFKIGTEWKYNMFSFRGGYRMIQTPYKTAPSEFDLTGYSFGLGLRFSSRFALDFAYDHSSYADQYRFLNIDGVAPARLDVTNKRFTSSLVFNF